MQHVLAFRPSDQESYPRKCADKGDHNTASIMAARGGHLACLQWLGDHGADMSAVNAYGDTASIMAAMGGHLVCLKWLGKMGPT